ncbi:MAG: hypothetical protein Q9M89_00625, partial [Persephonella sp.]|nr:hypothetical protein [Persephonella sp.]
VLFAGTLTGLLFFLQKKSHFLNSILSRNQVEEIPLYYFSEEFMKEFENKREHLIKEKEKLKEKYGKLLLQINSFLKRQITVLKAKKSVEKHNSHYFLWGWVPEKKLEVYGVLKNTHLWRHSLQGKMHLCS